MPDENNQLGLNANEDSLSDAYKYARLADQLVAWYWQHGLERSQEDISEDYRLDAEWLSRLYDAQRRAHTVARRIERGARSALALYGESQAGKSTMLAAELDNTKELAGPEQRGQILSALQWDPNHSVTWTDWSQWKNSGAAANNTNPINPFNKTLDATAIPTRFFLPPQDPDFLQAPCEITLAPLDSILAALRCGYKKYCISDKTNHQPPQAKTTWSNHPGNEHPDQPGLPHEISAFEIVEALYRLQKTARLVNDDPEKSPWQLPPINDVYPCSLQDARVWVCHVLWNNSPAFTNLFDGLLQLYAILRQYSRIVCDQPTAAKLLRFEREQPVFLNNLTLREHLTDDTFGNPKRILGLFGSNPNSDSWQGANLGDKGFNYGVHHLQMVIREIAMPVRADQLEACNNEELHSALSHTDIIDFPGITKAPLEFQPINVDRDVFANNYQDMALVLKGGKTATVVRDYVAGDDLAGFCLLVPASAAITDGTVKIIGNAVSHWLKQHRDNLADKIPFWWVSTMFQNAHAQVDGYIQWVKENRGSLTPLKNLKVRHFAAHYPIWAGQIGEELTDIQKNDLINGLTNYLGNSTKGTASFRTLQLQALKPGVPLTSVRLLLEDIADLLEAGARPMQNMVTDLAEEFWDLNVDKALMLGNYDVKRQHRRQEVLEEVCNATVGENDDMVSARKLFHVPTIVRANLQTIEDKINPSNSKYKRVLVEKMFEHLKDGWQRQCSQTLAGLNKCESSIKREGPEAIMDSTWRVQKIRELMLETFAEIAPGPPVPGAMGSDNRIEQLQGLAQLMCISFADVLSGDGANSHCAWDANGVADIFCALKSREPKYELRASLPGDDSLQVITELNLLVPPALVQNQENGTFEDTSPQVMEK